MSEHPTEDEVIECAEFLDIDPNAEPRVLRESGDNVFSCNFETGESVSDHPNDAKQKHMVEEERAKHRPAKETDPFPEEHPLTKMESEHSDSTLHFSECDSVAAETAKAELEAIATTSSPTSLATSLSQYGIPCGGVSAAFDSGWEQPQLFNSVGDVENLDDRSLHQILDCAAEGEDQEEDIVDHFLKHLSDTREISQRTVESEVNIPLEYMNTLLGRLVEAGSSSNTVILAERPTVELPTGPPSTVFAKAEPLFNAVHPLPSLEIMGCLVALHGDPEWHLHFVQLFEVVGVSCNWCVLRACRIHSYLPLEVAQMALVEVQAAWGGGQWELDDRCLIYHDVIDAVAIPAWLGWMRFEHHGSSSHGLKGV